MPVLWHVISPVSFSILHYLQRDLLQKNPYSLGRLEVVGVLRCAVGKIYVWSPLSGSLVWNGIDQFWVVCTIQSSQVVYSSFISSGIQFSHLRWCTVQSSQVVYSSVISRGVQFSHLKWCTVQSSQVVYSSVISGGVQFSHLRWCTVQVVFLFPAVDGIIALTKISLRFLGFLYPIISFFSWMYVVGELVFPDLHFLTQCLLHWCHWGGKM